jgi:DNA-binding HxlR family transcriptional regulator
MKNAKPRPKRSPCPIACALDILGDKWTLVVVRDLACGKRYFNEFTRSPEGIATNILADRLQKLCGQGLVEQHHEQDSERASYRLTEKGQTLQPVMVALAEWGLKTIPGTEARMKPQFLLKGSADEAHPGD